jgi:putative oxidoreductase
MQLMNDRTKTFLANSGLLLLRLVFGGIVVSVHGWDKLIHFGQMAGHFFNPIGLGSHWSLALVTFAEFFCGIAVVLGFATRMAAIPLIVSMSVAVFFQHAHDPFKIKELAVLYLGAFVIVFLLGAGRFSLDAILFRKR